MNKSTNKRAILACVSYFHVFNHPLKSSEISNFLDLTLQSKALENLLFELVEEGHLFFHDGFYMKENQPAWVSDRLEFEKRADDKKEEALKYGNLIRKFPFVQGVCISGSLSKHVMKPDADIDFFIIAKAKRIWIAKLFLKCYKFFFLNDSRESFCINYFIAEDNLYISEQNQYTATELVTLIPLDCEEQYKQLMRINNWYRDFLPNFDFETKRNYEANEISPSIFSKTIEYFFTGKWGRFVDTSIMKYNALRNRKKYANLRKDKDYELMLRATKNQIKVHDSNHQMNTLAAYHQQVKLVDKSFTS